MRLKAVSTALLLALIMALAAGACSDAEPTPEPAAPAPAPTVQAFPVTVTDSNGEEVTFDTAPQRIVAYDSAVVEILFAIGEGHRLAGTHDFASHPPEVSDVPRVGDAFTLNLEAIVALEPDLVFIFSEGFKSDLERAGLKVLYQKSLQDDLSQIADNVRMWGRITGGVAQAEASADGFQERVASIRAALTDHPGGLSVFQDEGDLWTPGPDTLMARVFELLKLQNIAHDLTDYAQLSPEVIVDRDPAIIIASYGDTLSANPAFSEVSAIKEGRVYVPGSDALSVAGPRFVQGIEELAKYVYPELFE